MSNAGASIAVSNLALLPASARRRNQIIRAVALTLRSEKAKVRGELNIVILTRKKMLALNKQFLNHNYNTDVIAFNYSASPKVADAPFGDVYISAYMARVQAKKLEHSVLEEVLTLVVHGTLHLLGYDDRTPRLKAAMFKRQDKVLATVMAS